MRKSRKSNVKKERIIMIASSAFVLTALTMTGMYMKAQNAESQDDGYTLDLAELESDAGDDFQEIVENVDTQENVENPMVADDALNNDDAMDFMPFEVGSGLVEIPGLTDDLLNSADTKKDAPIVGEADVTVGEKEQDSALTAEADEKEATAKAAATEKVEVAKTLHFTEEEGLLRPVSGEVLLPFSMDGSIYFSTLDHYKYNPALMLFAETGTQVLACVEGNVVDVFQDAQIGTAVTMDIGDGYQITYGQLENVTVNVGDYVSEGEVFASVAAPTKYFSLEGSNLYLKVTAEGAPVNPEVLFR